MSKKSMLKRLGSIAMTVVMSANMLLANAFVPVEKTTEVQAAEAPYRNVMYYGEWSIYAGQKNYTPDKIPGNYITHLNFAFMDVDENGNVICCDSWADFDNANVGYASEDKSPWAGVVAAMIQLRNQYPNMKIGFSVGGWTRSGDFPKVAANPTARKAFAENIARIAHLYGYDFVDIDWEYPTADRDPDPSGNGVTIDKGCKGSEADTQNFTLLLQDLRDALDKYDAMDNKHYELSVAMSASPAMMAKIEYDKVLNIVDFANMMTYDLQGAWSTYTGHQTALYTNPAYDAATQPECQFSVDACIKYLYDTYGNSIDASKIVVGIAPYTRGWAGVQKDGRDANNPGLFATAEPNSVKAADNTTSGTYAYGDIDMLINQYQLKPYYDETAEAAYYYSESTGYFFTCDNERSVTAKANYVKNSNGYTNPFNKPLGGLISWMASLDAAGSITKTSHDALFGASYQIPNQTIVFPPMENVTATVTTSTGADWGGNPIYQYEITIKNNNKITTPKTQGTMHGAAEENVLYRAENFAGTASYPKVYIKMSDDTTFSGSAWEVGGTIGTSNGFTTVDYTNWPNYLGNADSQYNTWTIKLTSSTPADVSKIKEIAMTRRKDASSEEYGWTTLYGESSIPQTTAAPRTTAEPATQAPTTQEPTTVEPTTQEPTTVEPTTQAPQPTVAEPTTQAPQPTVTEPITQAPQPTVTEPITQAPEPTTAVQKDYTYTTDGNSATLLPDYKFIDNVNYVDLIKATNATASASSELNSTAGNAIDEEINSRWESAHGNDNEYITFDLGSVNQVKELGVIWETAAAKDYKVQVSVDGTNFTDAAVVENGASANNRLDTVTFNNLIDARYVRVQGVSRALPYGYSIYDLAVYGVAPQVTTTQEPQTQAPTVAETTTVLATDAPQPTNAEQTTISWNDQPTDATQATVPVQTTTQAPITQIDESIQAPYGLVYAGNVYFPYYFAWGGPDGMDGFNVYVNGAYVTTVVPKAANLDASVFPVPGVYTVGVQSVRGNAASKITAMKYNSVTGEATPIVDEPATTEPTTTVWTPETQRPTEQQQTTTPWWNQPTTTVEPTTVWTPETQQPTPEQPTTKPWWEQPTTEGPTFIWNPQETTVAEVPTQATEAPTDVQVPTTAPNAETTQPTTEAPTAVAEPTTVVEPTTVAPTTTTAASATETEALKGDAQKQEEKILSFKTDSDPAGATFRKLRAQVKNSKKTSNKVTWKKQSGATKYIVYGAKCGSKNTRLAITTKASYTQKGLKKGTYYKYLVVAINNDGKVIAISRFVHSATKGGKIGNVKSLKLNKKKVTLKKGKKLKVKVKQTADAKGVKIKNHRKISYESSNTKVATVSKKGVIKAKGKGKCTVFVFAQNGVYKTVKVTVK